MSDSAHVVLLSKGIAWPALALVASLFIQHYELRKTVGAQDAQEDKSEPSPVPDTTSVPSPVIEDKR